MESLAELSKEFGYDYSHISKIFSKTTKQSLAHYYRFQRLETARSLLSNGMSVSETAQNLNYSSVYSFSVAFKKQYGLSPLKYKQNCLMKPLMQNKN
jgi:AraC-like DNA-binding protein